MVRDRRYSVTAEGVKIFFFTRCVQNFILFHSWILSYALSGVSKVSQFFTWCRIKNSMHRYTSRGYFTPSIQISGDYLKICGLGSTDGLKYIQTNLGTHVN